MVSSLHTNSVILFPDQAIAAAVGLRLLKSAQADLCLVALDQEGVNLVNASHPTTIVSDAAQAMEMLNPSYSVPTQTPEQENNQDQTNES